MSSLAKQYFETPGDLDKDTEESRKKRILLATVVILLEIAHSDNKLDFNEEGAIRDIMTKEIGISLYDAYKMLEISKERRKNIADIREYTDVINKNFSRDEKFLLLERIWKVAYADGILDKHEDLLADKVANLLNLDRKDLVSAQFFGQFPG